MWVLRKIRHFIESSKHPTIIYTNHGAALGIAKQITLFISSINKFNLRFVKASNYIQRYNLIILHKPEKFHVVPDALSKLPIIEVQINTKNEKLDVLIITINANIDNDLLEKILKGYAANASFQKISKILNDNTEDGTNLPFSREENDLIYRFSFDNDANLLSSRRIIVPEHENLIKDIIGIAHGENHLGFERTYEKIIKQ